MSTCGYVCPLCGGKKITDEGKDCHWCQNLPLNSDLEENDKITNENELLDSE